jgi:hypothetical protein
LVVSLIQECWFQRRSVEVLLLRMLKLQPKIFTIGICFVRRTKKLARPPLVALMLSTAAA